LSKCFKKASAALNLSGRNAAPLDPAVQPQRW
jgi:hypothetical protein